MPADRPAIPAPAQRRTAFARIEDEAVAASAAGHDVAARAAGDQVVARPGVDRVIAFLAQNDVISAAGIDRVIAARAASFLRQFRIIGADIGDRVLPVPVGAITRGITRFGVHAAFERLEYRPARSRRSEEHTSELQSLMSISNAVS